MLTGYSPPPGNQDRVFDWGQQGQIEMKPFEQVGQSTLAASPLETASMEQSPQVTADPRELVQQQHEQELSQFETALSQAEEELTRKSKYALSDLDQQFQLKAAQLQNKYRGKPREEFQTAWNDLQIQHQLAQQKIVGKVQPDLDLLRTRAGNAVQEKQQAFKDRMLQLDTIDELEKSGTIVDPVAAKQARLRIAGVNLPITAMREARPDPYRELQRTDTILRGIQQQLDQGLKYNFETGQVEGQLSAADKEQLTAMKNELTRYRLSTLLPAIMPQYSDTYKNGARLTNAAEAARGTITATGEKPRTIGTLVTQEKPKTAGQPKQISDPLGLR